MPQNQENIKSWSGTAMTPRERWRRVFHYQTVDRIPHYEFGYWSETYGEWHKQGLPKEIDNEAKANRFFGFDPRGGAGPNIGWLYGFEHKVLEDKGDKIIVQGSDGVISEVFKDGTSTIPHYIKFPIENREDWEKFKDRLRIDDEARYPKNWDQIAERLRHVDHPIGVNVGSLYGWPRNWIGFENISLMLYDDYALVEEIVETICELIVHTLQRALRTVEYDYGAGWEDMCFNNGPMISPAMFKKLLVPRYKRIADLLHRHGVDVIYTDCDGNINDVAGLWLEAGYNCMFPIEVRAGSDPVKLRKRFGKDILLLGGVDKMALIRGKSDILKELKRLSPVVEEGGFIPHVDHRVPPDVPYENYLYYLREKKAMLGFRTDELDIPGIT